MGHLSEAPIRESWLNQNPTGIREGEELPASNPQLTTYWQ